MLPIVNNLREEKAKKHDKIKTGGLGMGKKLYRSSDKLGKTKKIRTAIQETETGLQPETEDGIYRDNLFHAKHGQGKHPKRIGAVFSAIKKREPAHEPAGVQRGAAEDKMGSL